VSSGYPVNATDELRTFWELELTREGDLDMDSAFSYFKKKSILWNVHPEAKFSPFIALGFASVCE